MQDIASNCFGVENIADMASLLNSFELKLHEHTASHSKKLATFPASRVL